MGGVSSGASSWLSSDSDSDSGKLSTDVEFASFESHRGVVKGASCRGEGARGEHFQSTGKKSVT